MRLNYFFLLFLLVALHSCKKVQNELNNTNPGSTRQLLSNHKFVGHSSATLVLGGEWHLTRDSVSIERYSGDSIIIRTIDFSQQYLPSSTSSNRITWKIINGDTTLIDGSGEFYSLLETADSLKLVGYQYYGHTSNYFEFIGTKQ